MSIYVPYGIKLSRVNSNTTEINHSDNVITEENLLTVLLSGVKDFYNNNFCDNRKIK